MATFDAFKYGDSNEIEQGKDSLTVLIPQGINGTQQLLTVLRNGLNLPEHFGFNWGALSDCLRDLHWISQRSVLLIHQDVPSLNSSDLANYLDVLNEAVHSWQTDKAHQLGVVFPRSCRELIERMADA